MQKIHNRTGLLNSDGMASQALAAARRTAAAAFHLLEHLGHPLRRRGFRLRARAVQRLPDAGHLRFRIARVAPGEDGVDRGALQSLMSPAKDMDGRIPGKDVSSQAFQLPVHAAVPRFLSKARSRFWRSVSRAVSFS